MERNVGPQKAPSYVGSSRYATISLAIEVVLLPPSLPFSTPLCMHYLPHPCSHPHPQRHPDGGVTFIPHVALSSVLSLITSVCDTRLATPHSPLDLFNFCHLLHFNSPQRVMSFSTHPNASQKGARVKRGVDNLHLDEPRPLFILLIALPKINLDSNYSTKFSLKLPLIAGNANEDEEGGGRWAWR